MLKKRAKAVKGKPAGRMLTKTESCPSFFNFFNPPAVPENPNQVDEDEMEELQQAMEEDYELGCVLGRPDECCRTLSGDSECIRLESAGARWGGCRMPVTCWGGDGSLLIQCSYAILAPHPFSVIIMHSSDRSTTATH